MPITAGTVCVFSKVLLSVTFQLVEEKRAKAFVESLYDKDEVVEKVNGSIWRAPYAAIYVHQSMMYCIDYTCTDPVIIDNELRMGSKASTLYLIQ